MYWNKRGPWKDKYGQTLCMWSCVCVCNVERFSFILHALGGCQAADWFCGSAHTDHFSCISHVLAAQIGSIGLPTLNILFYTLWRHAMVKSDSLGLPISVSTVFRMLWRHARVQVVSIDCPHRSFLLCFACLGGMPGYSWLHWIAFINLVLSFTACEAMPGCSLTVLDCLPWTFELLIALFTLCRHARLQIDSIGLSTLNVSIVFYKQWRFASMPSSRLIPSIAHTERFHYVSHTLESCQGIVWCHWIAHTERLDCVSCA